MLYYHQEPKQNCAALNVPARNKELVMGTKISEAVQESNCSALAFITCWDKDHVERRSQPCRARLASWWWWWDLGSFCPNGIRNPASDPEGKEPLSGAGACPECRRVTLCVRYSHC